MILGAWYEPVLATLYALLGVMLMGLILLQRGRGVGLAGAFGGAGANTAFGSKTGDFLTWATVTVASIFFLFVILLNYVFVPAKTTIAPTVTAPPLSAPTAPGGAVPPTGAAELPPGDLSEQPVAPAGGETAPPPEPGTMQPTDPAPVDPQPAAPPTPPPATQPG